MAWTTLIPSHWLFQKPNPPKHKAGAAHLRDFKNQGGGAHHLGYLPRGGDKPFGCHETYPFPSVPFSLLPPPHTISQTDAKNSTPTDRYHAFVFKRTGKPLLGGLHIGIKDIFAHFDGHCQAHPPEPRKLSLADVIEGAQHLHDDNDRGGRWAVVARGNPFPLNPQCQHSPEGSM